MVTYIRTNMFPLFVMLELNDMKGESTREAGGTRGNDGFDGRMRGEIVGGNVRILENYRFRRGAES